MWKLSHWANEQAVRNAQTCIDLLWHGKVQLMEGRHMSASWGHPSWVISITVRSRRSLINSVFWSPKQQIATADDASRCSTVSRSEYGRTPSFQLHPWSIVWLIRAVSNGTSSELYGLLNTYDETQLLLESIASNSLTMSSQSRPS